MSYFSFGRMDINRYMYFYFMDLFHGDEKEVIKWFVKNRLLSDEYECPVCHSDMKLSEKDGIDGFEWSCQKVCKGNRSHNIIRSIRTGTIFEGTSEMPLCYFPLAIYGWIRKYRRNFFINVTELLEDELSDFTRLCRSVCMNACVLESDNLGGYGKIIEMNESSTLRQKLGESKSKEGTLFFYGTEKGSNKCFVEVIRDRHKDELLNVIRKYVLPGSVVISDAWKEYHTFDDEGFHQFSIDNCVTFKSPKAKGETFTLEKVLWNRIKETICKTTHDTNLLESYLVELLWRKKHNDCCPELYYSFLKSAANLYPPRYKDEIDEMPNVNDDTECAKI